MIPGYCKEGTAIIRRSIVWVICDSGRWWWSWLYIIAYYARREGSCSRRALRKPDREVDHVWIVQQKWAILSGCSARCDCNSWKWRRAQILKWSSADMRWLCKVWKPGRLLIWYIPWQMLSEMVMRHITLALFSNSMLDRSDNAFGNQASLQRQSRMCHMKTILWAVRL
jgi:hypothetical protein